MYFFDCFLQIGLLKHFPQFLITLGLKRIQVLLDGAFEQERSLGNNRDVLSQRMKTHLQSIASAHFVDRASFGFANSEDGLNDGTLSCSSSSYNSDLFSVSDLETYFLQNQRKSFSISHREVIEFDCSYFWPFLIEILKTLIKIHSNIHIFLDPIVFIGNMVLHVV